MKFFSKGVSGSIVTTLYFANCETITNTNSLSPSDQSQSPLTTNTTSTTFITSTAPSPSEILVWKKQTYTTRNSDDEDSEDSENGDTCENQPSYYSDFVDHPSESHQHK